ncbi:MAG: hypothetical protein MZV65_46370 [Chromatiales bacterium]|nr:hypothetical protein [Chromatiales bacterium]
MKNKPSGEAQVLLEHSRAASRNFQIIMLVVGLAGILIATGLGIVISQLHHGTGGKNSGYRTARNRWRFHRAYRADWRR